MDTDTGDLRQRVRRLESMRRQAKREIASKTSTIRKLRTMLMTALEDVDLQSVDDSEVEDKEMDEDEDDDNPCTEASQSESDDPSVINAGPATWDDDDNVYRCNKCFFEIEEGLCGKCLLMYDWDENDENLKDLDTIAVESDAISNDRCTTFRGTTPEQELHHLIVMPSEYRHRRSEYRRLIRYGATNYMCQTFHLEYSRREGIIAWADQDIFESFSGPGMVNGDKWKIYLGRRVSLDLDDEDGSLFLEGLLEDIIQFPVNSWKIQWHTFKESEGIWATRPDTSLLEDNSSDEESSDDEMSEGEDEDNIYEDNGANIPANVEAQRDRTWLYDALLEFPFHPNNRPLIDVDKYETDEDEDEGEDKNEDENEGMDQDQIQEDELEIDDPGWEIKASVPDAEYEPEGEIPKDDEVSEMQEVEQEEVLAIDGDEEEGEDEDEDSDEPGSDWDSDEQLSGDEL